MNENLDNNNLGEYIFSLPVVEFVTVANQYCIFVENYSEVERSVFIHKSLRLLSILYLKTLSVEKPQDIQYAEIEKFVGEIDWTVISDRISEKLGEHDIYFDVVEPANPNEPVNINISECFADIYQDLKDFTSLYKISVPESINEGLWECLNNFENFWGPRVLSVIKELHTLAYGNSDLHEKSTKITEPDNLKSKGNNRLDKFFEN